MTILSLLCFSLLLPRAMPAAQDLRVYDGQRVVLVELQGLKHTRPIVVLRELYHREGVPFILERWQDEKGVLEAMDLFSLVTLDVVPVEGGVALTYHFTEIIQFIVFPSVKRTDLDGWIVGPAVSYLNAMGMDTRVELYGRTAVSKPLRSNELWFLVSSPWLGPWPVEYEFDVTYNDSWNSLKLFDEKSVWTSVALIHRISGPWRLLYGGELFTVRVDREHPFFSPDGVQRDTFSSPDGWEVTPRLSVGAGADTRNRKVDPRRGLLAEIRFSQAGYPGGVQNYREYLADFRIWHEWIPRHIVHGGAMGRYRPGSVAPYDYLFVGGTNTLRTYVPDEKLFALHEIICTAEYRYEAIPRVPMSLWRLNFYLGLELVCGTDQVWIWRDERAAERFRRLAGYYAGFHVLAPGFERLRVEAGFRENREAVFGFSVGLWEKTETQRWRRR